MQFVSYNGDVSTPVSVTSGVVQGSIVGPQLFTMMINDLPKCAVTMRMLLYADDGKVMGKASSLQDCELNQNDLDAIYDWSVINQLPLYQPKSQCLHIGHKNGRPTYMLGGAPILAVEECTDLGVIRTSDFSYATRSHQVSREEDIFTSSSHATRSHQVSREKDILSQRHAL